MTIEADPDELEKHGHTFDGHVSSLTEVYDYLYSTLAGDTGMRGKDAASTAYSENYLERLRGLADSIKGACNGVSGISLGMRQMAADYRATDDASLQGVNSLTAPTFHFHTPQPGTTDGATSATSPREYNTDEAPHQQVAIPASPREYNTDEAAHDQGAAPPAPTDPDLSS